MSDEQFVWTKAHHAACAGRLAAKLSREVGDMVGGMWNPLFCADDGRDLTEQLLTELSAEIKHYRGVLARARKSTENAS